MRVTIVSPYDPRPAPGGDPLGLRGGVEEALDRCASGLAARGHDVTIVCSAPSDAVATDADGVRVVRVRRRGALFRVPLAPLWRHVPADAQLVHVPATYPGVSDAIPWRERRSGRAVVVDHHFDVQGTSLAMRAAAALHGATLARAELAATRVVCKSADYAARSPFLSRVPRERLDVVPNGVDVDAFPLSQRRTPDILCVGRLVPYKGVHTLLAAMPRIHAETGARLTVVGDGPERARLHTLAARLRAPVHFRGRVTAAELPILYGSHRLTILPSANGQEAFGIALLESMATGTPVVASDLPGVREVASLAGAVAPANDAEALARAVVRAWREPRAFGSPGEIRARVAERYAWPRVLDALEAVYARALDEAASKRALAAPSRIRAPAGGGA
ncbi:MAG TPA: glycosyltransferase family 4 protein [Candidatus Thermoplasmatota archaeon]|nr:glycosyltransferase family 4 protein [Candidatus Thermoplasmatota archaeon]